MQTSTFPECLKIARVYAKHKSGSKSDIKNYRPVFNLFKIILSNNVYSHIMPAISNSQDSFMKGRCTCTNLAEFTQLVSNILNLKEQVDVIRTYLSKTFDTVYHKILLDKLRLFDMCDLFNLPEFSATSSEERKNDDFFKMLKYPSSRHQ